MLPSVPSPSELHMPPSQRATWLADWPPAVVNRPPTMSCPWYTAKPFAAPSTPAPRGVHC